MEAAQHGVPTVGYTFGLRDSVINGKTGILVEREEDFVAATKQLLADAPFAAPLAPTRGILPLAFVGEDRRAVRGIAARASSGHAIHSAVSAHGTCGRGAPVSTAMAPSTTTTPTPSSASRSTSCSFHARSAARYRGEAWSTTVPSTLNSPIPPWPPPWVGVDSHAAGNFHEVGAFWEEGHAAVNRAHQLLIYPRIPRREHREASRNGQQLHDCSHGCQCCRQIRQRP